MKTKKLFSSFVVAGLIVSSLPTAVFADEGADTPPSVSVEAPSDSGAPAAEPTADTTDVVENTSGGEGTEGGTTPGDVVTQDTTGIFAKFGNLIKGHPYLVALVGAVGVGVAIRLIASNCTWVRAKVRRGCQELEVLLAGPKTKSEERYA